MFLVSATRFVFVGTLLDAGRTRESSTSFHGRSTSVEVLQSGDSELPVVIVIFKTSWKVLLVVDGEHPTLFGRTFRKDVTRYAGGAITNGRVRTPPRLIPRRMVLE